MTKIHNVSSLLTDPRARKAKEDLAFARYSKASRPGFLHFMPGYDPDYDKYIDVFEPDEGMFLVREKDIVEQPRGYFLSIRKKMEQNYDKKFLIEPLEGKGILVSWKSDPEHPNNW